MRTRNFPRKVEARQARAAARDVERAGRSPREQLALVAGRRGESRRERARLGQ